MKKKTLPKFKQGINKMKNSAAKMTNSVVDYIKENEQAQ